MTEQESRRGKSRRERVEFARSRDILDVANELRMELVRSGRDYRWKEHDSLVISPDKNLWKWFSRNTGGDAISLVETIKEVNFNQSVDFLNDGNFKEFQLVERPQEDFKYYLEKYEQPFSAGRDYLRNQRGLSDETIDYFLEQGVLAQANAKLDYFAEGNSGSSTNAIEPVIVFKSLSSSGEVVGASLQGIQENWEKWPKHGYAKVIMKNSDPMTGIHVDIGSPKRLIFTESPIDLMSYYELHKDSLQDVRLVSMDGLKESTIGRHLSQIKAEMSGKALIWTPEQLADGLQVAIDRHFFEDGKNADLITLALDNDKAGRTFIQELEAKGAVINSDLPELRPGQDKTDWNDVLKNRQEDKTDNSRLAQAQGNAGVKQMIEEERSTVPPELFVAFDFTENPNLSQKFSSGDVIPYKDFIAQLYEENNLRMLSLGYDKTYFALQDEKGSRLTDSFRYDIGSEDSVLSTQLGEVLPSPYLEQAQKEDDDYHYQDLVEENVQLDSVVSEEKEKSLEGGQETTNNSEQDKKNETKLRDFSEQAQEAAPLPEVSESQPLKDLSPSQTESHSLLYFTINNPEKSIYKENYHPIKPEELNKLNHHTDIIQDAAQWYLDNLSDTTIHYFYLQGDKQYNININFQQHHFMHLTGLFPIKSNQTAVKTLHDFAEGRGEYDNILVSNKGATFQKIKVLPDLKSILETESFYFDQVEDIPKLKSLSMEKAIQSEDKDIVLALSSNNENIYPASLMELTDEFRIQIKNSLHQNVILGIFQEKDGEIHKVAINKNYIEDDGERMLSVLKNKQFEEIKPTMNVDHQIKISSYNFNNQEYSDLESMLQAESRGIAEQENLLNQTSLDPTTFTQVLDTVYNLGVPADISKTPEEFHQAWNQYLDYAKQHNDKFDQIVAAAVEDHLLDTNSDFYREWKQDYIYKENYHVRLQWDVERPNEPRLPFKETELISYQDFARELYKANQDFYPIHQEGMKQVTASNNEGYIPPTKIKFDVYAPGGEMIKEGIRYDVGAETTPISQMLGLGYRRLNGQSELALMDEEILSQLENKEVNKEISQEANESARLTEEVAGQTLDTRETVAFQSSKQETKNNLLQRVEEILKEEPISDLETPEVNSSSIDYATLTPHELSEVAFQKVREYTETPGRLEEYLNFMSKFPELSPRNVALIQEQWPGANAVATYNQWQSMGEVLGITSDQVFETRNTYTNKKTGRTREVVHNNLSVKTGEKSHITLFRPMMVEMIPVLDENGNQVKNGKGNPKYKRLSEATPEEKVLKKEGKLNSRLFQERDSKTGLAKFATYKVFELSQTTLKPEFYPKAMPNRHYDFNMDHIRTKEVLEGLSDYAKNIGVTIYQDDAKELRSAKGAFYPDEQKILLNPDNTPGEVVATTIHELAHASLHNPKFANSYKEDVSKDRRELEAEMTSYLVSKHFGLDTSEKAIRYMAIWTDNLTSLDDQQLAQSMKRIHGTVSKIVKSVEQHTKPYQLNRQVVQNQNFIQSPKKGLKV